MLLYWAKRPAIGLSCFWIRLLAGTDSRLRLFADDVPTGDSQQPVEIPSVVTATVYANTNGLDEPAFTFKRVQKQSGAETDVVREFRDLAGKLAARERVEYEKGALLSYEFAELQTGASGR